MITILTAFSGISVDDSAKAKDFYSHVLGLGLDTDHMGLRYKLPGGGIFFIYEKKNHMPATYTALNFVVSDIDAEVADLKSKGITFEIYEGMNQDPMGIARGKAANKGPDIAWFKDPAGNILSLIQN